MEELIPLNQNNKDNPVSARDLYIFLGYDMSNWAKWYKKNIIKNQFAIEGKDWVGFVLSTSGNETMDFAISFDFAQRLAMMAKTKKGDSVRTYFIECEKRYKSGSGLSIPQTLPDALRAYATALEEKATIEARLIEAEPKVEYYDNVLNSKDLITTTEVGQHIKLSPIKLNRILEEMGVQKKVNGTWTLTAKYVSEGYADLKTHTFKDKDGKQRTSHHLYWTQKGREFIYKKVNGLI